MKLFRRTRRTAEELKTKSSWKEVLLAIYHGKRKQQITTYDFSLRKKREFTDDHSLAKTLKISGEELAHHLNFLVEQKLIKPLTTEYQDLNWPRLTSKGFDVAVKIEGREETRVYRLSSLMLCGLLIITTLAMFIYSMELIPTNWLLLLYIIVVILLWVVVLKLSHIKPFRDLFMRPSP